MRRHMDVPQDALRKAAVVVACLDDELAQRLLGRLSPGQSALLRRVLRGLGPVSDRERDATIVEFFRVRPMHSVDAAGGVELDQSLAQRLGEVSHTETRNEFDFLANTNPQQLTELLQNERPQTIAVVLANLDADHAAEVIAQLNPAVQVDVMGRLTQLNETDGDSLRAVGAQLQAWLQAQEPPSDHDAGVAAAQRILASMQPQQRSTLLGHVDQQDRRLAGRLQPPRPPAPQAPLRPVSGIELAPQSTQVTRGAATDRLPSEPRLANPTAAVAFDQLNELDSASLTAILRRVTPEVVILALAGADQRLVDRVASLLPVHEATKLRREIASLGPTRLSDVEMAQGKITREAEELVATGSVRMPENQSY